VQEPETEISKLIDFLKVDKSSIDLVNCIKKELYRNKAT
jgi:hypothetical protein